MHLSLTHMSPHMIVDISRFSEFLPTNFAFIQYSFCKFITVIKIHLRYPNNFTDRCLTYFRAYSSSDQTCSFSSCISFRIFCTQLAHHSKISSNFPILHHEFSIYYLSRQIDLYFLDRHPIYRPVTNSDYIFILTD